MTKLEGLLKDWIKASEPYVDNNAFVVLKSQTLDYLSKSPGLQVDYIMEKVIAKTGVSLDEIRSKSRKGEYVKARRIAAFNIEKYVNDMYYQNKKKDRGCSLATMGLLLNKDHSTILHYLREAERDIDIYKEYSLYDIGL